MSNWSNDDVFRFVVVFRSERGEESHNTVSARGRVFRVAELNAQAIDSDSVSFTDLAQLPEIMRKLMTNQEVIQGGYEIASDHSRSEKAKKRP